MKGAVLWDMDGTLVDSAGFHWQSWRETMAAEGVTITHEQFMETFGQRNDAIIPRWLGPDVSPTRIQAVGDAKEELYRKLVRQNGIQPLPGAAEWVKNLSREGWPQALASSAPRANVGVVLEVTGLASFFQAIVSAEDVTHGKPDPQVFLTAASRLGMPATRCIVVEDATAGIEAARRAGMRSIDVRVRPLKDLPLDAFRSLLAIG